MMLLKTRTEVENSDDPVVKNPPKVLTDNSIIYLPEGLIGFPDLNRMEILYKEDQLPFMWLKDTKGSDISFFVVEPGNVLDGYSVEISDADVAYLELNSDTDVLLLNIVTILQDENQIFVNLIGPIVVNRKTRKARQVIIQNSDAYSARHPLLQAVK